MANWQRKFNLNPEWSKAQDGKLSPQEMAGVIATRLRALEPIPNNDAEYDREELAERFEGFACESDADVAEFDDIMSDLYDWGDRSLDSRWNGKKVCWIDTISA